MEGDENADEIELRVDEIKTPKGEASDTGASGAKDSNTSDSNPGSGKKLFLLKTNSKEKEDRKKSKKGKTKSNSELSTAENVSSTADNTQNKAKKSSSNRSINRNNSSSNNKAGYNIFNFLFHSPTTEK